MPRKIGAGPSRAIRRNAGVAPPPIPTVDVEDPDMLANMLAGIQVDRQAPGVVIAPTAEFVPYDPMPGIDAEYDPRAGGPGPGAVAAIALDDDGSVLAFVQQMRALSRIAGVHLTHTFPAHRAVAERNAGVICGWLAGLTHFRLTADSWDELAVLANALAQARQVRTLEITLRTQGRCSPDSAQRIVARIAVPAIAQHLHTLEVVAYDGAEQPVYVPEHARSMVQDLLETPRALVNLRVSPMLFASPSIPGQLPGWADDGARRNIAVLKNRVLARLEVVHINNEAGHMTARHILELTAAHILVLREAPGPPGDPVRWVHRYIGWCRAAATRHRMGLLTFVVPAPGALSNATRDTHRAVAELVAGGPPPLDSVSVVDPAVSMYLRTLLPVLDARPKWSFSGYLTTPRAQSHVARFLTGVPSAAALPRHVYDFLYSVWAFATTERYDMVTQHLVAPIATLLRHPTQLSDAERMMLAHIAIREYGIMQRTMSDYVVCELASAVCDYVPHRHEAGMLIDRVAGLLGKGKIAPLPAAGIQTSATIDDILAHGPAIGDQEAGPVIMFARSVVAKNKNYLTVLRATPFAVAPAKSVAAAKDAALRVARPAKESPVGGAIVPRHTGGVSLEDLADAVRRARLADDMAD